MKTRVLRARADEDLAAKVDELARLWGPYESLTPSAVIRRCVEQVHAAEVRAAKPPSPAPAR